MGRAQGWQGRQAGTPAAGLTYLPHCVQVWHVADGRLQLSTLPEYLKAHSPEELAEMAASEAKASEAKAAAAKAQAH